MNLFDLMKLRGNNSAESAENLPGDRQQRMAPNPNWLITPSPPVPYL